MPDPLTQPISDFLQWVADRPRTYGDVMDAWRSSCPRLTVWEDAIGRGLVEIEPGGAFLERRLTLTSRGRAALIERS